MRYLVFLFLSISFLQASPMGKPFVEGRLTGQLGNQMFVIAATVSLALDHDAIPIFPDLIFDKTNNIPFNYEKVFYHLNTKSSGRKRRVCEFYEKSGDYAKIPYTPGMRIHGYFQSEKYFKHHKEEIIKLFSPHPEIIEYLRGKYGKILQNPCTVSIHLRSYYDHDPEQKIYPQYGREYVEKAVSLFPDDAVFLVFSNKMEDCKRELANLNRTLIFIEGQEYHYDLYLMSLCKHNIICNSSFSWWAAYLNQNKDKKIIVPPFWFTPGSGFSEKDLVPEEWERISL